MGNIMKKVSILAIIVLMVISPLASYAKSVISDEDLDNLTAETGVSIAFSNVSVVGTTPSMTASWGDNDGFTGSTGAGYAGMTGMTLTGGPNITTLSSSLTVDIGTSGGTTVMNIGLPTITLGTMNADASMTLSGNKDLSSGGTLALLALRGFYTTGGGGTARIYTHTTEGLSFYFDNVTVMGAANMTAYAWGDSNGFTGNTSMGYSGMGDVAITGNVARLINTTASIDVGTSGTLTAVSIVMPTITVGTMNVVSTMKLSPNADLSVGPAGVLGVLDMRGFSTQVNGSISVYSH